MSASRDSKLFLYNNKFTIFAGSFALFESLVDNAWIYCGKHSTAVKFKHGLVAPLVYAGFFTMLGHGADKLDEVYERKIASKK